MNYIVSILLISLLSLTQVLAQNIELTFEEKLFIKNNPQIIVGAETDWPPFDFVENNKYTGIAKDYLDLIEKKSGLDFKYDIDTWENLLEKTKQKNIDLLPALSKTSDREKYLLFTDKYITTRDYLITKKTTKDITAVSDLSGKTVAIVNGYVQDEVFRKKYPNVKRYYVNSFLESLDAVITNKADFIVSNIAIINYHIQKKGFTQLEPKFYFGNIWNQLHMAVGHHNKTLRNIINKSLQSITEQEHSTIHHKWFQTQEFKSTKKIEFTTRELNYLKEKKDVYIANELDWIPYDYFEDGKPKGYIIDYIKIVCEKLGLNPIFVTNKWSTLIKDFKKGEIEILPVISYNKKREKFLYFTKPIINQQLTIVTKKSRRDIINMDDLSNKKIGMIKNWNITNILKKEYPDINIIEFDSLIDLFDAIQDGFIDATIQNNILSNYYINQSYYDVLQSDISVTLKGFNPELHMGISQQSPILYGLVNKAISTITQKELELLENKWIKPVNQIELTKKEVEFIHNTTIKIVTGNAWAPFTFEENGDLHGIGIDLWRYIEQKNNIKSEIVSKYKFTDILQSFKDKKSDIILSTSKTKDKEDLGIFTNQYLKAPIGIATLLETQYIQNAKELLGKKIAVGKNFSAHKLLEEKYPNMDFVFVKGVKEGLDLVSHNKAYAYVDIMPVLSFNIEKYSFTNIKISGQTGLDFKLVSMIRSDYPLLKSIIDKTLRNMTYQEKEQILEKWLKAKYEKHFDYSLLWKIVLAFLIILFFVLYKNRQLKSYQHKLEEAQKDTEHSLENFKKLMNFNIAGILIIKDNKIIFTNDEIVKILEYNDRSDLLTQNINLILNQNEVKRISENQNNLHESFDTKAKKINGEFIPILVRANSIVFENKNSIILSIVDLSDLKNKEGIILQQSKMASLGEMIGNIAHQWRQPLSYISTAASGMKVKKEFGHLSDEEFMKLVDGITDTTMFLSQTIDDFRDYIKGDTVKKEFHIKDCISKVLSLMEGSFNNNFIKYETKIDDITINGFENQLNQVLLNLLSNSKDALKEISQENRKIFINCYKKNDKLIVEVIDSGGGIKEDVLEKVFEPYFTTKHQSQGTGLGLYMTHDIVKKSMKGDIQIQNIHFQEYYKCTKVSIILPIQ